MRQAELTAIKTIEFKEVDIPQPKDDEVLLEVLSIGVCGSDVHAYHGVHPYIDFPIVQGHEVSARVKELGSKVTGFEVGDLVTIEPQRSCGKCLACESGNYNICDELQVIGCQVTGAASDYYVCPANRLVKLDPNMDPHEAAMMEALSVAVRANKIATDVKGKNVLVFGAGPIGNFVAQTAKGLGAAKVMVSEINPVRLAKAKECGIDFAVNPAKEDLEEAIVKNFGARQRADIIFECAGADITIQTAIKVARKGTPIVVVAVFGTQPKIDLALLNENELQLVGTARYVIDDFETAKQLAAEGKVKLAPLITEVIDFDNYNDAYKKIDEEADTCMKLVIKVND